MACIEEYCSNWTDDLKKNLLSGCSFETICKICNYNSFPSSMRSEIWKICLDLNVKEKGEPWDEIFDLPEQPLIRTDCMNFVGKNISFSSSLGNEEEDNLSVVSDVESVITKFCKETGSKYSSHSKWFDVLAPLIALHLPNTELYSYFCAIQKMYIPKNCTENSNPYHLLRLLLLYHEPEVCSLLDTKKISPDTYAKDWFASVFSSTCNLKVTQMMWDIYFQYADPFFIFFLALVILVNSKDQLLEMKEENRQSIIDFLRSLPCDLEEEDVKDFCTLARYYVSCTPHSFAKEYFSLIFGDGTPPDESNILSQALCLPVSVQDLVLRNSPVIDYNVTFFVVDCRPADQYNSGHLSTAFHLEASLMLQEPSAFSIAVEALLAAKDQSIAAKSVAAGDQICFMGSGREEEDQYVHMVIASFLQKHQKYISLTKGGYSALHDMIQDNLDSYLADHCPKTCLKCKPELVLTNGVEEKECSIIDRLATAVKSKGVIVRERLFEYITNPQITEDRHVSCSDPLGRRYRGMHPIFSIDDEHDETKRFSESEENSLEEVSIQTWRTKPSVIGAFECDEIKNGFRYPSHLVVTDSHMYILRVNLQRKDSAFIMARRPLANIAKITCKRKCPEIITFKYEIAENEQQGAVDQLLIPKAGDATSLIKYHIPDISDSLSRS